MIADYVSTAALYLVPLLFGVVLHEVAHGWMAEKFGDSTARRMGRITLNPLVHIDPVGTILLPVVLILIRAPFLFGWAKPVPVRFENLKGGRRAGAVVALAGPATNFLLAVVSAGIYHLIHYTFDHGIISSNSVPGLIAEPLFLMARISVTFNLVLMVINLLPIPPLDGGRVLAGLLPAGPASFLDHVEKYGMLIVLLLIGTRLWEYIVQPVLAVFLKIFLG
jgi:Zn-dependent protease